MAPKLIDNLLPEYPGLPENEIVRTVWPRIEEDLHAMAMQVPEFGAWEEDFQTADGTVHYLISEPTRRAVEEISSLFFVNSKEKKAYSLTQISKNIELLLISFRARLAQLLQNPAWQCLRVNHDERARVWVDRERRLVQSGEKPLKYYPDITYPPFVSSTDKQFRHSSPNFAKIVQARMSNPTNRYIVEGEVKRNAGTVPDSDSDMVSQLILDPRIITDRQVEILGITAPWQTQRRMSKRERLEFKAEVIERIKRELQVMRLIGDGSTEHNDFFGRHRVYASRDGYIIGTTNLNSEKPTLYKATLRKAIDRTRHVGTGASAESRALNRLIATLLSFDQTLAKSWEKVKDSEELETAKNLVAAEMGGQKKPLNKDKKEAKALLKKAMDLDSTYTREIKRGSKVVREVKIHIPLTAKRAQLRAAIGRLQHRLSSGGRHIPRYNANDRAILEEELGRNEAVPFTGLLAHLEDKDKGRNPLMDSRRLKPEQKDKVIRSIQEWCTRFNPEKRGAPLLEPYRSLAESVTAELQKTVALVDRSEVTIGALKDALDSLRGYLLVHRAWKTWEDLYESHLSNDRMPYFHKFILDLERLIKSLPEISPEKANEPVAIALQTYRDTAHQLILICRHGIALMSRSEDQELADKARKELKKLMNQVDIIKILRQAEQLAATERPPITPTTPSTSVVSEESVIQVPSIDEAPISEIPPTLPSARDINLPAQSEPGSDPSDQEEK